MLDPPLQIIKSLASNSKFLTDVLNRDAFIALNPCGRLIEIGEQNYTFGEVETRRLGGNIRRIELGIFLRSPQHGCHPIVEGRHQSIRRHGNHGIAVDRVADRWLPLLPHSIKREKAPADETDVVRMFASSLLSHSYKPPAQRFGPHGALATATLKAARKAEFFGKHLRAGTEHLAGGGGVPGKEWDETPARGFQHAASIPVKDGR